VGYPRVCLVGLVECGTHVVFDAVMGPLGTGELRLAGEVFSSPRPGMQLLADRRFKVDL